MFKYQSTYVLIGAFYSKEREESTNMKSRLLVEISRFLSKLLVTTLCFFIEHIISSIGFMDFWIKDIPGLSMKSGLITLSVFVMISSIFVICEKEISSFHIAIKKNHNLIMGIILIGEVLFLSKVSTWTETFICIFDITVLLYLLEIETTKLFEYTYNVVPESNSCYIERPVVGYSKLTKTQQKAFDELKSNLDKRNSNDSYNIGLIGAWGSGKTSITDTLIYEYQKKNSPYFFLKINTLTLNETENIIVYIRNYFEELFRKYMIGFVKGDAAFLTALSECFSDKITFKNLWGVMDNKSFLDIDKEKELFARQVAKTLKVSKKKNIVLIIDDTDRNAEEEQIIKILSEFASINGIISIVSLDKSKDIILRPQSVNHSNELVYNPIDKYIHLRIRLEQGNHIEYEESVTKQIMDSFNMIIPKENCYITIDNTCDRNSLLGTFKDYPTTEIVSPRYMSQGTYNMLAELFFLNLNRSNRTFGDYFEGLVNEYILNTEELFPYIKKMLTTDPKKWGEELYMINGSWTKHDEIYAFDWLSRLRSNSSQILFSLCQLVESIDYLLIEDEKGMDVKDLDDLYEFWMFHNFPMDDTSWENRKKEPRVYGGLELVKPLFRDCADSVNQNLLNGRYNMARDVIKEKAEGALNLFVATVLLADFIEYFRGILNNYRTFKMQLRETELLNINYLEYLISMWNPRQEVNDSFNQLKEKNRVLGELQWQIPQLTSIINTILYENYISKFGTRDSTDLKDARLFIYHQRKAPILVVLKKTDSRTEFLYWDVEGKNMHDLRESIKEEIRVYYKDKGQG